MKTKNFVAKNLHKACKASIVPHKHQEKKQAIELQEMKERASEALAEGFTDVYNASDKLDDVGCSSITIE